MPDQEYIDRTNELEAQEIEAAKRQQEKARIAAVEEAKEIANKARFQGGQVQAYDFIDKTVRMAKMATLKRIKDSQAYKEVEEAGGTWAGYCKLIGFSIRKVDEDLKNLETFGEEFLEASHRLGLGYRDLATIRALPDETRLQITDGKIVNLESASKKEIREAVEDLIIRHGQETKRLTTQLEEKEKKLKQAGVREEAQEEKIWDLKNKLEAAQTGLGRDEQQALKEISKLKKQITGVAAKLKATDPKLKAVVKAESMELLGYMEALARLTMLELGLELGDGTTPAEVAMAQAEFEQMHGDIGPAQ